MAIKTPEDLRLHLDWAIHVELTTIPLYLYAMYSLREETSEAHSVIRSIVVEEMLHMCLACNLLLSVSAEHPEVVQRLLGLAEKAREDLGDSLRDVNVR